MVGLRRQRKMMPGMNQTNTSKQDAKKLLGQARTSTVRTCGTTGEHHRRILEKAVPRSLRRESSNVRGFGRKALGSSTVHL